MIAITGNHCSLLRWFDLLMRRTFLSTIGTATATPASQKVGVIKFHREAILPFDTVIANPYSLPIVI